MTDLTAPTTPLFNVPTSNDVKDMTPAIPASSVSHTFVEHDGKHTGVAGVARDILGGLGDFLLTRLHMKPLYAPAQQERRLNEAWQGADADPVAAIDRVRSIDFTQGNKLANEYVDNQRAAALAASTEQDRQAALARANAVESSRKDDLSARMLNTIYRPGAKPEVLYPAIKAQIQKVNPSYDLPDTYDENAIKAKLGISVPVATQNGQEITKERDDNQDEQAAVRAEHANEVLANTVRHQGITEAQGQARIDKPSTPRAARPIQSYTGDDGYRYTKMSDGSVIKSTVKVRPAGGGGSGGLSPAAIALKKKYGL